LYDRGVSRRVAYLLLIAAAAARLLVQLAAMPPYAGLDELYHVARLAFVLEEHRNPTTSEPSVPPDLEATLERQWNAVPSFALLQRDWHAPAVRDRFVTPRPYVRPNYEAQQPSLYYSLAAPLARLFPRTVLSQLRVWRLVSVFFALVTIVATATIGERWFGGAGIVAAGLMAAIPTWETLVVRAGNDAFACAMVAVALAVTVEWGGPGRGGRPPGRGGRPPPLHIGEALLWSLAIAAKLYTWPLAIALLFFWRWQRASRVRIIAVVAACAISAALTMTDLASRTGTAIGVDFARTHANARVDVVSLIKVTIASAAWTSGEHWDALRPLGIALYVVPVAAAIAFAARRRDLLALSAAVLGAFALAQTVNVVESMRAGASIGGGEGWYWFVLAPVLVPALLAPAVRRFPFIALWILAWDAIITAQLFQTWAGHRSPEHPSLLFRWGPHA
jgi:hypothetical protein